MTWKETLDNIEQDAITSAEIEYKCYGSIYRAEDKYMDIAKAALSALFLSGAMTEEEFHREFDRIADYGMHTICTREWAVEQDKKIIAKVMEKRLAKAEEVA